MFELRRLDGDSIRDMIDARECHDMLRDARTEARHSYGGSMQFEARGKTDYLIRRPYASSTRRSLGRRSVESERVLTKFLSGKACIEDRVSGLSQQLQDRAQILRARGLGRVPLLAARIMRKFDDLGWLGTNLTVLGTHALYAYEAIAAVRIDSAIVATGDVLFDARRRLVMSAEVKNRGLIGALQSVDRSFEKERSKNYTASNKGGFIVDLLEAQDHGRTMHKGNAQLSDHCDDLVATGTDSIKWFLNTPKFTATAFDERGLPVRIVTIDPRVYALQKLWISQNDPCRDAGKRFRDEQQAHLVAQIATQHLRLSFDDAALSGLPILWRNLADNFRVDEKVDRGDW